VILQGSLAHGLGCEGRREKVQVWADLYAVVMVGSSVVGLVKVCSWSLVLQCPLGFVCAGNCHHPLDVNGTRLYSSRQSARRCYSRRRNAARG
jgi:hypothetical protein